MHDYVLVVVVKLFTYLAKDYMYSITLLVSASVLDMHDYVLVEVAKLLTYLKPSFVLSWVLWRWIVVYLHACFYLLSRLGVTTYLAKDCMYLL
jgi:hypothetical protein